MEREKPECSYRESCFRRNPIHLEQMSHPHLDKMLNEMPDGVIVLPEKCMNRELLREQLEILRRIKENKSSGHSTRVVNKEPPRVASVSESTNKAADERRRKLREFVVRKMRETVGGEYYVPPESGFALKWILAEPYHLFFTAVQKSPETWRQDLSVTLSEILDRSLGDITMSLHLNMVVDFGWLCAQYMLAGQDTKLAKMLVFYGDAIGMEDLPKNIEAHQIKCPSAWGCHHGKVSIFRYADGGIRIVVSSANLYRDDWDFRTQGVWISPHLPKLSDDLQASDGESPSHFKEHFQRFLGSYDRRINEWKAIVSRADCSSINVAFVASVPGNYESTNTNWGHKRLATILQNNTTIPKNEASSSIIVAQASSIGNLGPNYERSWIVTDILKSMSRNTETSNASAMNFKFVFPTIENFKTSYDMLECSNGLCYTMASHNKQKWIQRYMCKWKADSIKRSRAMPHIKTFTRISSDEKRAWWFVLGSGNLSKAAWGHVTGSTYRIFNYEANVVFLPKFVTNENDFSIKEDSTRKWPIFPLPYDLPLSPYTKDDKPFVTDFFRDDYES